MNKQEREQIKRVAEGFADATKCVLEPMHDVNEHPSFAKALTKNFYAIDDLEQRVTKLEQGLQAAQQTDKEEQVKLPQDVQDFINRVCVLKSYSVCCEDGICCEDCIFYCDKGKCLLSVSYDLRHKYVVKD